VAERRCLTPARLATRALVVAVLATTREDHADPRGRLSVAGFAPAEAQSRPQQAGRGDGVPRGTSLVFTDVALGLCERLPSAAAAGHSRDRHVPLLAAGLLTFNVSLSVAVGLGWRPKRRTRPRFEPRLREAIEEMTAAIQHPPPDCRDPTGTVVEGVPQ